MNVSWERFYKFVHTSVAEIIFRKEPFHRIFIEVFRFLIRPVNQETCSVESDALEVRKPRTTRRTFQEAWKKPQQNAKGDEDEHASSSDRQSQCCVVGGVDRNQGGDADGRIHDQGCEETVAGDVADGLIDIV